MFRTGLAPSSEPSIRWLRRALHNWVAAVAVASGLATGSMVCSVAAARGSEVATAPAEVSLATLPAEARATHRRVLTGGPFPFDKDGIAFGNRERQLPPKARGYYREYTVRTPGARDRGARRLVCGGIPPTQPEACFYTDDHYASFRRIAP